MGMELELETLSVCEFFWPTTTDSNSTAEGTMEILAALGLTDALSGETDAQPAHSRAKNGATARSRKGRQNGRQTAASPTSDRKKFSCMKATIVGGRP